MFNCLVGIIYLFCKSLTTSVFLFGVVRRKWSFFCLTLQKGLLSSSVLTDLRVWTGISQTFYNLKKGSHCVFSWLTGWFWLGASGLIQILRDATPVS